eukprot:m.190880 g.190880  ORF g.190880 m.190880 type:complete len:577 (-) comp32415_c5_seq3:413-2143(-)
MDGIISALVVNATDLRPCDSNGLSDPFVKVNVITAENRAALLKGVVKVKAKKSPRPSPRISPVSSPVMLRKAMVGSSISLGVPSGSTSSLLTALSHPSGRKNSTELKINGHVKTTVKKKTVNPKWMEQLMLKMKNAEGLLFRVYDWDLMSSNDLCAFVAVDFADLHLVNQVSQRFEFELEPQGRLVIEIEYLDGKSLFGLALQSVITREGGEDGIPHFVKVAVEFLEENNRLTSQGLYRIPGSSKSVQNMKKMFCDHPLSTFRATDDVDDVCSLLKLYFRELPEPVFTNALFSEFIAATLEHTATNHSGLVKCLAKLPQANFATIKFLFEHLSNVMKHKDKNSMSATNLATCFGPTLTTPTDNATALTNIRTQNQLIEILLEYPKILSSCDDKPKRNVSRTRVAAVVDGSFSARASFMLTPAEGVFTKYASNVGDGLSFAQFKLACYSIGGVPSLEDFADARTLSAKNNVDKDGEQRLDLASFEEWLWQSRFAALLFKPRAQVTQAIEYFAHFDERGTGSLTEKQFRDFHDSLVNSFGYGLPQTAEECLKVLDLNKDGEVSLDEYLQWMLKRGNLG